MLRKEARKPRRCGDVSHTATRPHGQHEETTLRTSWTCIARATDILRAVMGSDLQKLCSETGAPRSMTYTTFLTAPLAHGARQCADSQSSDCRRACRAKEGGCCLVCLYEFRRVQSGGLPSETPGQRAENKGRCHLEGDGLLPACSFLKRTTNPTSLELGCAYQRSMAK